MAIINDRVPYFSNMVYEDFDQDWCPVCGGKIKHPYTGMVTSEQMEEDSKSCIWMEVQDENNYTLGWTPICHRIHPYTLLSEDNKYVHYDFLEMVNCYDDLSVVEKMEKLKSYILHFYKEVEEKDIRFEVKEERITAVHIDSLSKERLCLDLNLSPDGHVKIERV